MKTFAISLISSVCFLTSLAWPQTSRAQVPFVFQTTFNCPDWDQRMGFSDANVCSKGDGISGYGGWATRPNGSVDQLTAAANNPAGGGGKGFRHWRGNGQNSNGGGLSITLPAPVTEMWVRFYMRYSSGFAWARGRPSYTKEHYWNNGHVFGVQGPGSTWAIAPPVGAPFPGTASWQNTMGGLVGDGLWHCYEYHLRQNGANGIVEIWIDGVQVLNNRMANLGSTPYSSFILGSNQNQVVGADTADHFTDYDDIAISTTGYIGPITR
jgi:hypothetical protein